MSLSLLKLINNIGFKCKAKRHLAVDVGAHSGSFVKFLLGTGVFENVLAFEPNPDSYEICKKELNEIYAKKCEVIEAAISNKEGFLEFNYDEDAATGSLLPYVKEYKTKGNIKKRVVTVLTIDEYLKDKKITDELTLIKIDTQGNDLSVIQGARTIIKKCKPIIQTEFIYIPLYENQCHPEELIIEMKELSYTLYSIYNLHITNEGRLAFCDALFVPNDLDLDLSETQEYTCIDNLSSYVEQIKILNRVCEERLVLINRLDTDLKLALK